MLSPVTNLTLLTPPCPHALNQVVAKEQLQRVGAVALMASSNSLCRLPKQVQSL